MKNASLRRCGQIFITLFCIQHKSLFSTRTKAGAGEVCVWLQPATSRLLVRQIGNLTTLESHRDDLPKYRQRRGSWVMDHKPISAEFGTSNGKPTNRT